MPGIVGFLSDIIAKSQSQDQISAQIGGQFNADNWSQCLGKLYPQKETGIGMATAISIKEATAINDLCDFVAEAHSKKPGYIDAIAAISTVIIDNVVCNCNSVSLQYDGGYSLLGSCIRLDCELLSRGIGAFAVSKLLGRSDITKAAPTLAVTAKDRAHLRALLPIVTYLSCDKSGVQLSDDALNNIGSLCNVAMDKSSRENMLLLTTGLIVSLRKKDNGAETEKCMGKLALSLKDCRVESSSPLANVRKEVSNVMTLLYCADLLSRFEGKVQTMPQSSMLIGKSVNEIYSEVKKQCDEVKGRAVEFDGKCFAINMIDCMHEQQWSTVGIKNGLSKALNSHIDSSAVRRIMSKAGRNVEPWVLVEADEEQYKHTAHATSQTSSGRRTLRDTPSATCNMAAPMSTPPLDRWEIIRRLIVFTCGNNSALQSTWQNLISLATKQRKEQVEKGGDYPKTYEINKALCRQFFEQALTKASVQELVVLGLYFDDNDKLQCDLFDLNEINIPIDDSNAILRTLKQSSEMVSPPNKEKSEESRRSSTDCDLSHFNGLIGKLNYLVKNNDNIPDLKRCYDIHINLNKKLSSEKDLMFKLPERANKCYDAAMLHLVAAEASGSLSTETLKGIFMQSGFMRSVEGPILSIKNDKRVLVDKLGLSDAVVDGMQNALYSKVQMQELETGYSRKTTATEKIKSVRQAPLQQSRDCEASAEAVSSAFSPEKGCDAVLGAAYASGVIVEQDKGAEGIK